MNMRTLLEGVDIISSTGGMDMEITGVTHDSRTAKPGDLFVALKGAHFDGRDFVESAVRRGAAAVLHEGEGPAMPAGLTVPLLRVADSREALARLSNNYYGRPSEKLSVVGVTGTNGKTTTTRIIKSMLEAGGKTVGLIGTINYMVGLETLPATHTTPESVDFQRLLARMHEAGCSHVVTEVSSHALSQRRVDCTRFGCAVFTNLTRDHLDFHRDMEDYFASKGRLFEELLEGPAVINADDPYGRRLLSMVRGKALAYGIEGEADLRASKIDLGPEGLGFELTYEGVAYAVRSPLIGRPNVYNVLAAAGTCLALGISPEAVVAGSVGVGAVEGRFEKVEAGQDFLCVVDFAHTEDALRGLLLTAREFTKGRLITVFGCGGDRDRGKRPAMGSTATRLSDMVFITSDNPRGEDPEAIIRDIEAGAEGDNYRVVPDRAEAIRQAVAAAEASDTVVLAGKGHEEYQEIKGKRHAFSDRETAMRAIAEKIRRS